MPDRGADKERLIAEYGADNKPEAVYLLSAEYGWKELYEAIIDILRDDTKAPHWETAQIVLFYAANDHKQKRRRCPMPANSTIALLYYRFPDGGDEGDRIWSIVCNLKGVEHWSRYDPMRDPEVLAELDSLRRA